jgi:hypothetical protein
MLNTNVDAVSKQLQDYAKTMERKLVNMVAGFAENVARAAIQNTPLGDSVAYAGLYKMRYESQGLQPIEGLARGNWHYSTSGNDTLKLVYGQDSGAKALSTFKLEVKNYKLGQTFYIANFVDYIGKLEGNYSDQTNGEGIVAPTIKQIQAVYLTDLKRHYDLG